jgi:hypothetical protein
LWNAVKELQPPGRPFARGNAVVQTFAPQLPAPGAKIFRETERYWIARGVNVRSTLWAGPRGGAPFAAVA